MTTSLFHTGFSLPNKVLLEDWAFWVTSYKDFYERVYVWNGLVWQKIWESSGQTLLGCAGLCLQGSMTSIAPGSPGPYSDPKRAKSPWDPRDVPIQLLPFLDHLTCIPRIPCLKGLYSLFYGSLPWIVWMYGLGCPRGLGCLQRVAYEVFYRDQRSRGWKSRELSTKIRHKLVPDLYLLKGSGNVINVTIKSLLQISEMPPRK